MRLSYVIISYNRREKLLKTLMQLEYSTPLPTSDWEAWVVDNGSTDGTMEAVRAQFPHVNFIRLARNEGVGARNYAIRRCRGEYVVTCDDDSYPCDPVGLGAAMGQMDTQANLGALVGSVVLPNGGAEGPAIPAVIMSGATCFRRSVLLEIGMFPQGYFRQAEEYEVAFRIWRAGFRVERREDFVFRHEKSVESDGRVPAEVRELDLRNNLIVAQRFLPKALRKIYWEDWLLRYKALAEYGGVGGRGINRAIRGAKWTRFWDGPKGRPTLDANSIEAIFQLRAQSAAVGEWARKHSVWRVVLADFSKNLWATYNACRASGLQIRCVADDNPAYGGLDYRGLAIVPMRQALEGGGIDGVVVSNINPAQVDVKAKAARLVFRGPILKLWEPPRLATRARATAA